MVEEEGGTMVHVRKGVPQGGAWDVTLGGELQRFTYTNGGFPELDSLYVPAVPEPSGCKDYTTELVPDAWRLLVLAVLEGCSPAAGTVAGLSE